MTPPRWVRLLPARRLTCAAGHHLPEVAVFPEFGWQRCGKDARDPRHHARGPGAMPCAKWTLVVQVRGGVALCVDVTDEEHTRHRPCTSPGEVLAALGLTEWLGTA